MARTTWKLWVTTGAVLSAAGLVVAIGCGSDDSSESGFSGSGQGGSAGMINLDGGAGTSGSGGMISVPDGGQAGSGGQAPVGCGSVVTGTVRDFHAGVPNADFQCGINAPAGFVDPGNKVCGPWDPEIVGKLGSPIGPGRKPVYASSDRTPSTVGATSFAQWYADAPGVNLSDKLDMKLVAGSSGTFVYDNPLFFPIDGKLFGAEANDPDKGSYKSDDQQVRNFHFTYELHTTFRYDAGNVFTFRGDDDVLVYINDKLAMNLGGIHVPLQGSIALDTGRVEITRPAEFEQQMEAPTPKPELGLPDAIPNGVAGTVDLGLKAGEVYAMDFFFAERNCCASNFRIETNFVFVDCGAGPIK